MKVLIFVVGWLYLLTFQLCFTVLFNLVHILYQIFTGGICRWWRKRKSILHNLEIHDADSALAWMFEYLEDGEYKYKGIINNDNALLGKWPTWTALPFVILARKPKSEHILFGNCQDAYRIAKWMIKKWNKIHNKKVTTKLHIYVPNLSVSLVHYILNIGDEKIVSGEKRGWRIRRESRDECAKRILRDRFPKGWVWLR